MAEEIISAVPVANVAAPEVAAPAVAPAAPSPEPQPVVSPAVEPAAPIEAAPAPAESTLLTAEKQKVAEEKPSETKPTTEVEVKAPESAEPAPAPLPVFEAFKLPENITIDNEKISEFTNALAEFETKTKASHEEVQQFGQSLIDRHIKGIEESQNLLLQKLIDDGKKERESWKESFLKSPEFANRTDTVLNSAIDAIGIYGGTAEQQQEFRDLMASTGVGNHPAMIRMLSNMMIAKPEPKQLAAPTIAKAVPKSQMQKRYGNK